MSDLLDVNLWVALVDKRHVHHSRAQEYWDQQRANRFAFCRLTMLGFLRVMTSSKAILHPKTNADAWRVYRDMTALPNIVLLSEPPGLENHFQALTLPSAFPHRLWTDAYLAAFALAGGYRLVSFDADFARFPGLEFLHLSP